MKGIVLQIVCYVAALASFAPLPETSAASTLRPTIFTLPPTTTFNPNGTPCEGVRCPPGRHCALNESNQALCVCDGKCDDDIYSPVCGSDNKTYPNSCAVARKACTINSNLTINYNGVCTYEGSDCNGFSCPLNRVCAVAGNRPICVCAQNCPIYINRFCGSDNHTYNNDCELQKQSCLTNKTITIAYYGDCRLGLATPCDGFPCPTGTQCAIDERKKPVCVCLDKCPYANDDMVCGTDGRTYDSKCEVYRQACISATSIRIAYNGHCLNGSVCSDFRCPKNKICNVKYDNQPVCVCVQFCSKDVDMVCGSDGVTYQNLCQLEKQACTTGSNLTMVRTGQCSRDAFCSGVVCPYPTTCVVNERNQTSCVCNNDCGDVYYPVCGSDDKTYDNYCWFMYAACQGNLSTNYYMGVCAAGFNCKGIDCETGQHCDSLQQPEPKCVCDTYCPKTYSPVCGNNYQTYNNPCELQKDACLTKRSILNDFYGRCEDGRGCTGTFCSNARTCVVDENNRPMCVCPQSCVTESTEVCGTDGKTYLSHCLLLAAACMTNKTIAVQRYEPCKKESACDDVVCSMERHCEVGQDGKPICVCNDQCLFSGSAICGSDNTTHNSLCELQIKACISNSSIRWLYNGSCVVASVCDKSSCPPDKRCGIDEQYQAKCVCFDDCAAVQDPVCGSDGLTYSSECDMRKTACIANRNVTMQYRGKCVEGLTCSDISCPTGRVCAMTEKNESTCVCNTDCSSPFPNQVCGTDGKTYADICYLLREACTKNESIQQDYWGSCKIETSAASSLQPTLSTLPPTTTFSPKGTPCEGVRCPPVRHCAVDENNEATCVCDAHCNDDIYSPVCGSDNKTYPNTCAVIRKACATSSNLTLSYYGVCTYEGSDCNGFSCPLNRVCAVAGNRPICVCAQNCSTHINQFCGSDNQTYNNDCELQKQSCLTNKTITKAYSGDCKLATPCDGFSCPTGMKCAIDERKKPVCVCADKCPYAIDMVCGTDGQTYGNECDVYRQACISATSIRIAYNGHCLNGSVCSGFRCPKNRQCSVNEDSKPVCVCARFCSNDVDPVCGSDGDTYQNLCQLEKQACTTGTNLTMVRTGLCSRDAFCNGVVCPNLKTCVVNERNQTSCVCNNDCEKDYDPVCGSDDKTYDNLCWFFYAACQKNLSTNYYSGVCSEGNNCKGIFCVTGEHCDSLQQPEPKCVCDTYCSKTYSPVCGYNHKTYNNSCVLHKDACLAEEFNFASFKGRCEDGPGCMGTYCSNGRECAVDERNQPMCVCPQSCATEGEWFRLYEVCGTDGKTYGSQCLLIAAACMTNKTIDVQRYEPCTKAESACDGVVCSTDRHCEVGQNGKPTCVCNDKCTNYSSEVCGSDNKTYNNLCELQIKACISSSSIRWLYNGGCVVASVCDKISCPPDKRCAIDEQYQAKCVCFDDCIAIQDPVCGSDGLTYTSECEMRKSACIANRNVTMKYRGKCHEGLTCGDITCPTGRVCAMTEKNESTCVCNTECSAPFPNEVCGTDGKTYADICFLLRKACTKNENIQQDYSGSCTSDESSTTTGRLCVGPSCTTERTEQLL